MKYQTHQAITIHLPSNKQLSFEFSCKIPLTFIVLIKTSSSLSKPDFLKWSPAAPPLLCQNRSWDFFSFGFYFLIQVFNVVDDLFLSSWLQFPCMGSSLSYKCCVCLWKRFTTSPHKRTIVCVCWCIHYLFLCCVRSQVHNVCLWVCIYRMSQNYVSREQLVLSVND